MIMDKLPVFVVDDDNAVRDSLRWSLESSGYPVETFENAETFLEFYRGQPGVLVLDVAMPGMNGLELQNKLASFATGILSIIFVSAHGTVPTAVSAMRNGAVDFLMKPFDNVALLERVVQAMGKIRKIQEEQVEQAQNVERLETLTDREREVLSAVADGLTNKQTARKLLISIKTVETHRAHIMAKTGATSLAELIRLVSRANIMSGNE